MGPPTDPVCRASSCPCRYCVWCVCVCVFVNKEIQEAAKANVLYPQRQQQQNAVPLQPRTFPSRTFPLFLAAHGFTSECKEKNVKKTDRERQQEPQSMISHSHSFLPFLICFVCSFDSLGTPATVTQQKLATKTQTTVKEESAWPESRVLRFILVLSFFCFLSFAVGAFSCCY